MSADARISSEKLVPYAGGKRGPIGTLADALLHERLLGYRRDVAKKYRVLDHSLIERALPTGDLLISAKFDGELWFLHKSAGRTLLIAYNGRVLDGTPLVETLAKQLAGVTEALVVGELIARPTDGRPRVQHVASALNAENLEGTLAFHPFDLVSENGDDCQKRPYAERFARLKAIFGEDERTGVVTTIPGDQSAVLSYWREWVQTGRFEGLVVRSEHGLTYKIKPYFTIDAVVVAYGMRIQQGTPQIRELNLALIRDDGHLQLIGPVGGGFTEESRVEWYTKLSALEAPSSFRMANRDGTLCKFLRPEIIVEVKVTDLVETDSNDVSVHRMALTYDATKGYSALSDGKVPALLFPVFQRERTDKTFDVASVGMTQLTSRLASSNEPSEAPPQLADSEIVLRRVWTKGPTAVRKVALVETHKEARHGYAPFAVFGTDFSGGRAEPLKTTLRTASTREKAEAHLAVWIEENIKKGWLEVGGDAPPPAAEPPKKSAKKAAKAEPTEAAGATEPATDGAEVAEVAPKKSARKTAKKATEA